MAPFLKVKMPFYKQHYALWRSLLAEMDIPCESPIITKEKFFLWDKYLFLHKWTGFLRLSSQIGGSDRAKQSEPPIRAINFCFFVSFTCTVITIWCNKHELSMHFLSLMKFRILHEADERFWCWKQLVLGGPLVVGVVWQQATLVLFILRGLRSVSSN